MCVVRLSGTKKFAEGYEVIFGQTKEKNMRVFSVDELNNMKPGTVFEHSTLGKCMIMINRHIHCPESRKHMVFKQNYEKTWFIKDEFPWTLPMRVIN